MCGCVFHVYEYASKRVFIFSVYMCVRVFVLCITFVLFVRMFTCMRVYVNVSIQAYCTMRFLVQRFMYVYVFVCLCVCVMHYMCFVCMYVYMHACIHECEHTDIPYYAFPSAQIYVCSCVLVFVRVYVYL